MDSENQAIEKLAREMKCPECNGALKKRRSRKADACEMLCGVRGRQFDVCDPQTAASLKR